MDSDLADAVESLKAIFAKRKLPCSFGKAPPTTVDELRKQLRVPSRYRNFLLAANPEKVETVTPVERIRLIPAEELVKAQALVQTPGDSGAPPADWKARWVVIGESSLLGDPYFLDVSKPDPEGDCPVYTAMSGQDRWNADPGRVELRPVPAHPVDRDGDRRRLRRRHHGRRRRRLVSRGARAQGQDDRRRRPSRRPLDLSLLRDCAYLA